MSLTMSLSESIQSTSALKFNGNKFGLWKMKILAYLEDKELVEVVEDAAPTRLPAALGALADAAVAASPAEQKQKAMTEQEEQNRKKKCMKAYTILILTLQDEQLQLIVDIGRGDAHGVWKALLQRYERRTVASKTQARNMLTQSKMANGELVETYISRIKGLVVSLSEMGSPISNDELLQILFNGLPEAYESLIDSLTVYESLTFEEACVYILDRQERVNIKKANKKKEQEGQEEQESEEQANYVKHKYYGNARGSLRGGNGARGGSARGNGRGGIRGRGGYGRYQPNGSVQRLCYSCHQPGHIAFACTKNINAKKCDNCRIIGHTTQECYYNHKNNNNTSMIAAEDKEDKEEEEVADTVFSVREEEEEEEEYSTNTQNRLAWIIDTGATRHITNNKSIMKDIKRLDKPIELTVANSEKVLLTQVGKAQVNILNNTSGTSKYVSNNNINTSIKLNEVTYAPTFKTNLMSVAKIVDTGAEVLFTKHKAIISKHGKLILEVPRHGNLFVVNHQQTNSSDPSLASTYVAKQTNDNSLNNSNTDLWHQRMGHLSLGGLKKIKDSNGVVGSDYITLHNNNDDDTVCEGCVLGKAHRKAFKNYRSVVASEVMDCAHGDLCGPIKIKENKVGEIVDEQVSSKYVSTITDEASRKIFVHIINYKSNTADKIIDWCNEATVLTGKLLKEFHSDGGGEYSSNKLLDYFKKKGTKVTNTVKATPQHNGIAERANRTIFEMARSMLYHAKLSKAYWQEAVLTSVYIRNRCISVVNNNKTPEELFTGKKPHINHLRVFGCDCYVHIPDKDRGNKLDSKSKRGIFIGYDELKQGYKVYDFEANKVVISRDVIFNEDKFTFGRHKSGTTNQQTDIDEIDKTIDSIDTDTNINTHASQQYIDARQLSDPLEEDLNGSNNDMKCIENYSVAPSVAIDEHQQELKYNSEENQQPQPVVAVAEFPVVVVVPPTITNKRPTRQTRQPQRDFMVSSSIYALSAVANSNIIEEPKTYQEAMVSKDSEYWQAAMDEEIKALYDNNTWSLVKLPAGRTAIGSKWVFKLKLNKDGNVERYKARFCAKGYSQEQGIDYNETFAPVVKYKSLRIILALVAIKDYELTQMDVNTAFLNAQIKEQVYMKQPEGYEKGGANMVCKLIKTLYGTKQAPHEWNEHLNSFILSLEFNRCSSDTCVYVKSSRTGNAMIVSVFVDDIISAYATQDQQEWYEYKANFMNKYKMKDLGNCEWILGMRIQRDRKLKTLSIDQELYINKVLKQFKMENCKSAITPEEVTKLLSNQQDHQIDIKTYQSLVGALMYAAISTRPDITHAVNMISRYLSNPGSTHLIAGKRILRYLKDTTKLGLLYKGLDNNNNNINIEIKAYTDADWAGDLDERKSTTGYIIMINNCIVSWVSQKQKTVALSTAEAEYMAISAGVQEIKWIRQLLEELSFKQQQPSILISDNQAAIAISENDVHHHRTKHIDIRHHFIRDSIKQKEIQVKWIQSEQQLADVLTKGLAKNKFIQLRNQIIN
jgi:hypothetical protein